MASYASLTGELFSVYEHLDVVLGKSPLFFHSRDLTLLRESRVCDGGGEVGARTLDLRPRTRWKRVDSNVEALTSSQMDIEGFRYERRRVPAPKAVCRQRSVRSKKM
jgi:hypothetical protein